MVYTFKIFSKRFLCVVAVFCTVYMAQFFAVEPLGPLLVEHVCDRVARQKSATWIIESADGFTLYRERDTRTQRMRLPKSVVVRLVNGELFVQGKRFKDTALTLVPINGMFIMRGIPLSGSLRLIVGAKWCTLRRYSQQEDLYVVAARDALDALREDYVPQKKETALEQLETVVKTPQKTVATAPQKIEEQKERALGVKVLLAEEALDAGPLTVTIPSGRSWALDPNDRERFVALRDKKVVIERRAKQWWVNGQRISGGMQCWIRPEGGLCGYRGVTYHGSMLFVLDKDKILVINCLELEAYVSCVLYAECWPGWPLEINKVMAIACRSYALSMIADARIRHKLYHIKNTNIHQMYEGAHSVKAIHEAVELTRGLFLSYRNRPVRAMFDACCGGVIPAKVDGYDFVGSPFLARKQQCTYCKTSKVYRWEASYSLGDLSSRLAPLCPGLVSITDITVSRFNEAGLARTVTIKDKKRSFSIPATKVYSLLREVKSYCFTITKHGNAAIFRGRGYGHHMGLCQWGAREMVRQGYSYRQILSFYYPGVSLMRL
jgi:stage II sporulation protein D